MHRSATSLTAQLLASGGWHPGARLLSSEREAYYEDEAFVELNRAWTTDDLDDTECVSPGDSHADWGVIDRRVVPVVGRYQRRNRDRLGSAREYAAMRDFLHGNWVAKDPRGSLHAEVWAGLGDTRFVIVYRNPWDVVDSAVRLGEEVFCRRPGVAREAWLGYQLRLLQLIRDYRERVAVIAAEAVARRPERVWAHLDRWIGMVGGPPSALVDPRRFVQRNDDHAIAGLYRDVYPAHTSVLEAFDDAADIPRSGPPYRSTPSRVLPGGSLPAGTGVQVVIPCRDDGDHIVEAVASVEQHARGPVEMTIVDDGSSDAETLRVLDVLRASGRQIVRTDGVGLPAARNVACGVSRSAMVVPLDADNRLRAAMFDAAQRMPELGAETVHGSWERFGMDAQVVHPPDLALDTLIPHNQIDACAVIRRSLLERLGGWDDALPFWEDWDLWLRVACSGARTHRVDEVLFDYLVRPGALSQRWSIDTTAAAAAMERMMSKDERIRAAFEPGQSPTDGQSP